MQLTPSQDQIMGQLRQLLPALGMLMTALGWGTPTEVANWTTAILQFAGPAMILGGMIWSLIANTRKSIMDSAAANLATAHPEEKAVMVHAVASTLQSAAPAEKAAVVSAVAALPEVTSIALDKSQPATLALNRGTPSNVQVAA